MIEIPLIDELREIRRRLSEANSTDPSRYAAMLRQVAQALPGTYVTQSPQDRHEDRSGATETSPSTSAPPGSREKPTGP